jgi:hypothetical protein
VPRRLQGSDGRPGHRTVAARGRRASATTALSLRAFLQTPHPTMPNLILTPEETDDIIAYLLALKSE